MTDKAPVERIEGRLIRRTGWTSDARRCPIHGDLLELCLDETDFSTWSPRAVFDHDENRIRWRCEACVGSWFESYFLDDARDPPSPPRPRLLLTCPVCSSRRVRHECVPECCGLHRCIDCDTRFELAVDLLEAGTQEWQREPVTPLASVILSTPTPVSPDYRSGWFLDYRLCPEHGTPLELVFVPCWDEQPPTLLAWRCDECERSWTEPTFRTGRNRFAPDARAGAVCPHCRSSSIADRGSPDNLADCRDCRAALRLRLDPKVR